MFNNILMYFWYILGSEIDHEHNLKNYTSFLVAIMRTENLYQYQTETRRLAKVLKPFPASESQFRFKNFYEKSSITKAFLSVSVVPSKSRKSIENICDEENSRIYVASCTLKEALSSRWLARSIRTNTHSYLKSHHIISC